MLRRDLSLNQDVLSDAVLQIPIRQGFGEGLLEAGTDNKNIVALCADLTESTKMNLFAEKYPERFVEVGVAEQNLVTVASGMAAMGKIPFVSSYSVFSPGRNWEQIRTTICYNNVPVKVVGSHAGISVGPDGGSHQALEDIAITRVLPNMVVVVPCDSVEARKATIALSRMSEPAYLRLGREKTPVLTTDQTPFEVGKAQIVYETEDPDVGIIACGTMVYHAIKAAEKLKKEGIDAVVMNMATIKPLDEEALFELSRRVHALATVEEHQVSGGLGGAVAEVVTSRIPLKLLRIGVEDQFGQSGTPEELIRHYGLDGDSIASRIYRMFHPYQS